ncbi:MAG: TerB N-terminal domain-containing protein [Oscillospiraceae bacterium]|nr:TerB N-terminal domain-containing protein [Oscillospiraceae bacterium]
MNRWKEAAMAAAKLNMPERQSYTIVLDPIPVPDEKNKGFGYGEVVYGETTLPFVGERPELQRPKVPERIREMMKLYEHGDGSYLHKCRNFVRQGRFMEDYEDDAPWTGDVRKYFPTYHDFDVRQLRGYFTWRTGVRKGEYSPIAASLAYLYLYELLCGIGCSSPEDSLEKMRAFETGVLDSGIGDPSMRKNLRRWMLEYAVLHDLPAETARTFADPAMLEKDTALARLRTPENVSDEEVFSALCVFGRNRLAQSPAAADEEGRGKHLFAEVWRFALQKWAEKGKNLFEACFGEQKEFHWYPLSNALYTEDGRHPDTDYILDESRSFHCRSGRWTEERYEELFFDRKRLEELLHEADRAIRRYLKTGRNLQEKPTEAWARPYVEAVLEADRKAALEALKPKITIDLSGLEQIRRAASITRDSLLTEEEKNEARDGGEPVLPTDNTSIRLSSETAVTKLEPAEAEEEGQTTFDGLDEAHLTILQTLLRGETAEGQIRSAHLMPALVVDTINEAFYDEIGDNILEYDGNEISLIEDYREDVAAILGGNAR